MTTAVGIARIEPATSLRARVEQQIAAAIISGQMPAGETFSVPTLAAQFEVSATPVREAMLNLAKRGFVEPLRNKGFRVTEVDDGSLAQIVQVRHLLEPEAMFHLAEGFTSEMEAQARPLAERIVRGAKEEDLQEYLAADHEFHLTLLSFLGNPLLVEIVGDLRERTRLVGLTNLVSTDRLAASAAEHHELLDLLAARKQAAARDFMHKHIGHVVGWWSGREEEANS